MILVIKSHRTWLVPAIVHIDNTNIILLLGGKNRDNKFCLENLVEGFENHPKNEVNYKNEDNLKNEEALAFGPNCDRKQIRIDINYKILT